MVNSSAHLFFGHCFKKQRSSNRTAPIYVSGSKLIDMPLFLVETYDDNSIVLGKKCHRFVALDSTSFIDTLPYQPTRSFVKRYTNTRMKNYSFIVAMIEEAITRIIYFFMKNRTLLILNRFLIFHFSAGNTKNFTYQDI